MVHFIDNTVALSAFVHGYVGKEDLADIVGAYHIMSTGLRARTYFDYVPSKANLADDPSRGDHTIPRMLGAHTASMKVPTLEQLTGPLEHWFDTHTAEAHGRAKAWPS